MAMFEEAEPPKEKTDEGNLWKIIFLIIALAVAAMLIRFVWVLFKP
jgi:flagellar basal body-associated protein FliL